MEYQILTEESRRDLEAKVNQAIEGGWRPLGGVAVTCWSVADGHFSETYWGFTQAMTREHRPR
jgi:hypothetical protein